MPIIEQGTSNIIPSDLENPPQEPLEYSELISRKAALVSESLGEDYQQALTRYNIMSQSGSSEGVREDIKAKDLFARRSALSEKIASSLSTGTSEAITKDLQAYQLETLKEDALERRYLESLETKMSPELRELDEANPDLYTRKKKDMLFMQHVQTELARVGALEASENLLEETVDAGKTILGIPNLLDNNNPWEGSFSTQISDIQKKMSFIKNQPSEVQPVLLRQLTEEILESRIFDNPQDALDIYGLALSGSAATETGVVVANTLDSLFILSELKLLKAAGIGLKSGATKIISDDVITTQAAAGSDSIAEDIINAAGKIVKDGDEAAEIMPFLRPPHSVVDGVSEAVAKRLQQNHSEIIRVIENFAAPERLHEIVAKQAKEFEKDVIGRQLINSTIDPDTGRLVYQFGTTKGVPFKTESAAKNAAQQKGIEKFEVLESKSGYVVKVDTATADAAKGFNEVGMIGKNLGNVSDVVKSLLPIAQRAEDASGAVVQVMQKIINKDLAPFMSGKKSIPLNRVLEEAGKQKAWFNDQEFRATFQTLNGRAATDKELKAYWAYGQLNDLSYSLSVRPALDDIAARGDELYELTGLVDSASKLPIAGKPVSEEVVLGVRSNKENVMIWGERPQMFEKGAASLDEFSSMKLLEVNPRWSQKFMELGYSNVPVKYLAVPAGISTRKAVPTDVLNYLPGPRTSNASPFFIKSGQVVEDGSGKLYRLQDVTLASASSSKQAAEGAAKMQDLVSLMRGNKEDLGKLVDDDIAKLGLGDFGISTVRQADDWMKGAGLYNRSVKIQGIGNRDTVDIDDVMGDLFGGRTAAVDDYAFSSPHSQVLFGKRTEGIKHISGEASTMLDPMAALAESMDKAVSYSTSAAFRERSLQFMQERMGKYLDTRSSNPYALLTANVKSDIQRNAPKVANAVEAHQKFLANMLGQPDRFETTWAMLVDNNMQSIFKTTDKFFSKGGLSAKAEKELLEKRQAKVEFFGKDPITKVRALTFHSTLGLGSIPSFIMQAINMVNITAIAPKYGSRAATQAPVMRMALFASDNGATDLIAKHYKILGFKSADEFKSYVEEFKNLGFDHIGHTHALIAGMNGAQVNTGMLARFADKGRWFFDQGELLNRLTAYGTARRKWDELIGKGKPANSAEGRSWIGEETHRLTLGMSGADLQIGLRNNLVSIPTQFMSYPLRFLNAITPDVLGGSKSFTKAEKTRLALMNILMFGGAGVPLVDVAADYITKNYEMDPVAAKQLTNGLIDTILFAASDGEINSNFSGRAGNAEFLNQIMDAATGDKNFMELLGGAAGSKLVGFHSSLDEFLSLTKAMANPDLSQITDATIDLFIENISSLKSINKSYLAYTEGFLYSKNGAKLAHISKQGAIAMAIGLPPQAYEDIGAALARKEGRDDYIKDMMAVHSELIKKYTKETNPEARQEILKNISLNSALMATQGVELEVAQKLLAQDSRGTLLEYLAQEEQRLKDSTPEEGRKDFNEQFIKENEER